MTDKEIQRAQSQARRFFERDVPELTDGARRPEVTIKLIQRNSPRELPLVARNRPDGA